MNLMFGQVLAGAGLGVLVGLLVGLSSSPVVATVVGALAAALVTLLGFTPPSKSAQDAAPATALAGSAARLASFGFTCAAALLFGLYIRTHALLSPSVAQQVAEIRKAQYTEKEAREWVAYQNLGAPETGAPVNQRSPASNKEVASILFAGANEGDCQYFDTARYKNTDEQLKALRLQGGKYAEYANKISALDPSRQRTELDALKLLSCPQ